MTHEQAVGCALWAMLWVWAAVGLYVRWRDARSSTPAASDLPDFNQFDPALQTGKWEQDEPYAECFSDEGEDDLDG